MRPSKCPFMSVAKQGGKHQFPNLVTMCVCVWKMSFLCQNIRKIRVLWKMGPVCTLVTMGWKNWSQSVIMFISPVRMNWLKTASSLLQGRGRGKTHVTLIQKMRGQWFDCHWLNMSESSMHCFLSALSWLILMLEKKQLLHKVGVGPSRQFDPAFRVRSAIEYSRCASVSASSFSWPLLCDWLCVQTWLPFTLYIRLYWVLDFNLWFYTLLNNMWPVRTWDRPQISSGYVLALVTMVTVTLYQHKFCHLSRLADREWTIAEGKRGHWALMMASNLEGDMSWC